MLPHSKLKGVGPDHNCNNSAATGKSKKHRKKDHSKLKGIDPDHNCNRSAATGRSRKHRKKDYSHGIRLHSHKIKQKNINPGEVSLKEITYGHLEDDSDDEEYNMDGPKPGERDEYGRMVGVGFSNSSHGRGGVYNCFGCNLRSFRRNNPSSFIAAQHEVKSLRKKRKQLDEIEMDFEQERRNGCILLVLCATMMCVCAILFVDQIYPTETKPNLISRISDNLKNKTVIDDIDEIDENDSSMAETKASKKRKKEADFLRTKQKSFDPDLHFKPAGGENNDNDSSSTKTEKPKQVSLVHEEDFETNLNNMEVIGERVEKLTLYEAWNIPYKSSRGIPIYFNIPKSGSVTIDEILSHCIDLVQASDDVFLTQNRDQETTLSVFSNHDGAKYVNVNMGTIEGIKRAKELKLVNENKADVVWTSLLYETAGLFQSSSRRGKCFTLLPHPLERAVAVYNSLHKSVPKFKDMTVEEYSKSEFCEENWMVRHLSQELEQPLGQHHLELAKEVLGRKCIVGFSNQFDESMRRFEKYFGWDLKHDPAARLSCEKNVRTTTKDPGLQRSNNLRDELHSLFKPKNMYDLELYNFAQQLFREQALYGHS